MQQEMVVLEGKVFTVDLQSMLGSTAYGWCLAGLPDGIILEGIEMIPTAQGVAPVIQRFYFGVSSVKAPEAELTFVLACTFQPDEIAKEEKISLTIIPHNSDEYVSYNENLRQKEAGNAANAVIPYGVQFSREAAQAQMPYGMIYNQNLSGSKAPMLMYGVKPPTFPCTEYGFPSKEAEPFKNGDSCMAYGYPCGAQDTMMKYGYPCGVQDANMKYGYFCNRNEPFITKYGYPCC